jgi:putative DNA primase/helicase
VDIAHRGLESLEALQTKYDILPPTWLVTTGTGGQHYWYKTNKPIRNTTRLGGFSGLDIRGEGGYVIAPPSMHKSGNRYETSLVWSGPITLAPDWLVKLCLTRQSIPSTPEEKNTPIPEGQRNDALTRDAGAMRRRGLSEQAIAAALLIENRERCQPPLEEIEVLQIAKSVCRYAPEEPPKKLPKYQHGI